MLETPLKLWTIIPVRRGKSLAQFPLVAQSCPQLKHHDLPLIFTCEYFSVYILYFILHLFLGNLLLRYPRYLPGELHRLLPFSYPLSFATFLSSLGRNLTPSHVFLYRAVTRTLYLPLFEVLKNKQVRYYVQDSLRAVSRMQFLCLTIGVQVVPVDIGMITVPPPMLIHCVHLCLE